MEIEATSYNLHTQVYLNQRKHTSRSAKRKATWVFPKNALSNGSTFNADEAKTVPYIWVESSKPQNFSVAQLLSFTVYCIIIYVMLIDKNYFIRMHIYRTYVATQIAITYVHAYSMYSKAMYIVTGSDFH